MNNIAQSIYRVFIQPKSSDDDARRRESILNVLLLGIFVLAIIALVLVVRNSLALGWHYTGLPPVISLIIVLVFSVLIFISRRGLYQVSAYALVAMCLLLAFYSLYIWGISLSQGILVLALSLVMASILLGTRVGAFLTVLASVGLILLGYLQQTQALSINTDWMKTPGTASDALVYAITLGVIMTVSWLSNREIERSLDRARRSEEELLGERDLLEVKVRERTKELEAAQREKIMELSRFAEFGRLSSGIIHELVNPLTTVALNLEQMHDDEHSERLKRAIESTKRMERYIDGARKQLQNQTEISEFELKGEMETAIEFLSPEADKQGVTIDLIKLDDPKLTGNPIKFHQLITNLVANAISAYEKAEKSDRRRVAVELWKTDSTVQISVRDWGSGIPKQFLDKVFDPFFTLKAADQGMGIGLSLCKEIVENEFDGTIEVESEEGSGTTFVVRLPMQGKRKHAKSEA